MRRLWIERQEAMAGCLAKMKVYIEDHENGDTVINDVPCRKLGEVKNGQQKRFTISEDAAKVFVVADKISRNMYNEFVRIPEGREDIFLSGKNYLKPFAGNPFRFDGVTEKETVENRARTERRGSRLLLTLVIIGILAGAICGGVIGTMILLNNPETVAMEDFQVQELQITLAENFEQLEVEGYTACYASSDMAVFLLREDFGLKKGFGDLSVEEYGAMVLANNQVTASAQLRKDGDLTVFDYEYINPDTGNAYYYYTVLAKGPDAFWMVQFSAPAKNAQEHISLFRQWASSIRFAA